MIKKTLFILILFYTTITGISYAQVPCDSAEWAIWVEQPACEEDTGCAGEIGLWIDMGNPPYKAFIYDYNSSTYSDTLISSGSGPGYFQFYRCEGTYEGYLLDSNGCTFSLTVVVGIISSAIQQGDTLTLCKGDSILLTTQEPCQSVLAYFPLDGNTNDESGYGNNGTLFGGFSYVDDRFGNSSSAILFDGWDGYLNIPDAPHYDLGNEEFSISYWVMRKDSVDSTGTIGGNPNIYDNVFEGSKFDVNSLNGTGYSEWILGVGNGLNNSILNKPSFLVESATSSYIANGTSHLPNDTNTWTFMTGVRDGDSLKIYYNGVLEGSSFIGSDTVNNTSDSIRLAFFQDGIPAGGLTNVNAHIAIDEFTIYDCALSEEEIAQLYHNGALVDMQSTYWTEGDINTVIDSQSYVMVAPDSTTTYYYVAEDTFKTCIDSIIVLVLGQ
ncbi:MAG TPA: LamG domain-containing protein, partial [Flavobacteriales bacterium]|nr:LamG domain-containing protein [Flavobacteriales bacterium]